MSGDGMSGLSWAISAASLCILVLPGLFGGAAGYFVLRKHAGWLGAILGFVVGAGAGALAVTATFYESTWSPPDTLVIDVPPGFAHPTVMFVADPAAPLEVEWTGLDLPLMSRRGRVSVPATGVVRVRSVEWIGGTEVRASLSTGATETGLAVVDVPGIGRVVALDFAPYPGALPSDPAALAAAIRERESAR